MARDKATDKYRRTRLFVLTLGYSRKSVRLIVPKSSTRTWAELHERAFRQLGGAPRVVVLDNLREGVLTPDVYDPTLNPLFRRARGRQRRWVALDSGRWIWKRERGGRMHHVACGPPIP